jgi:hypothetical protein
MTGPDLAGAERPASLLAAVIAARRAGRVWPPREPWSLRCQQIDGDGIAGHDHREPDAGRGCLAARSCWQLAVIVDGRVPDRVRCPAPGRGSVPGAPPGLVPDSRLRSRPCLSRQRSRQRPVRGGRGLGSRPPSGRRVGEGCLAPAPDGSARKQELHGHAQAVLARRIATRGAPHRDARHAHTTTQRPRRESRGSCPSAAVDALA